MGAPSGHQHNLAMPGQSSGAEVRGRFLPAKGLQQAGNSERYGKITCDSSILHSLAYFPFLNAPDILLAWFYCHFFLKKGPS